MGEIGGRLEGDAGAVAFFADVDHMGHAVDMAFDARPMGLDFGPVEVGEENVLEVTVTNEGLVATDEPTEVRGFQDGAPASLGSYDVAAFDHVISVEAGGREAGVVGNDPEAGSRAQGLHAGTAEHAVLLGQAGECQPG